MRTILVRHTRPQIRPASCYGRLDVPLASSAEVDIMKCLAALPRTERLFTSPARRCLRLADAVANRDGVEAVSDPRLLELDFGAWEGLAWADVPRGELERWSANLIDIRPGGGESLRSLWLRVADFAHERLSHRAGNTTIVSHHGPLRVLHAQIEGRSPESIWDTQIPFGACLVTAEHRSGATGDRHVRR